MIRLKIWNQVLSTQYPDPSNIAKACPVRKRGDQND